MQLVLSEAEVIFDPRQSVRVRRKRTMCTLASIRSL